MVIVETFFAKPHSKVGKNRRSLVRFPARPIFFPRINDSHCDMTHSSVTAVRFFDNRNVGKQPVAWKEYCVGYWLKELQESMDRCTGRRGITKILLKRHYTPYNQRNNFRWRERSESCRIDYHHSSE